VNKEVKMLCKIKMKNILVIFCFLGATNAHVMQCVFQKWINSDIIECKVQNMYIYQPEAVNHVIGYPARTTRDVQSVNIQDQTCKYIPSNMNHFFPAVENLNIGSSSLMEMTSEDMRQFPMMRSLSLNDNNLQSLENNVFENCPYLENLDLGRNNIKNLGTDILAPLQNLNYVNMEGNSCASGSMTSPNQKQNFQSMISQNCPPTPEMIEREEQRKTTTPNPIDPQQLEDILRELKELREQVKNQDKKIEEIERTPFQNQPQTPPPPQESQYRPRPPYPPPNQQNPSYQPPQSPNPQQPAQQQEYQPPENQGPPPPNYPRQNQRPPQSPENQGPQQTPQYQPPQYQGPPPQRPPSFPQQPNRPPPPPPPSSNQEPPLYPPLSGQSPKCPSRCKLT
jgi:hypothetical protein